MRKWLKNLRTQNGYTQTEIANKLGITQHYYCSIESGERQKDLDLSFVTRIANIFDVSIEWIVEQENLKNDGKE